MQNVFVFLAFDKLVIKNLPEVTFVLADYVNGMCCLWDTKLKHIPLFSHNFSEDI